MNQKKKRNGKTYEQILVSQAFFHLFNHLFIHSIKVWNSFVSVSAVVYVNKTDPVFSWTLQSSGGRRKWTCNSPAVSARKETRAKLTEKCDGDWGVLFCMGWLGQIL